MKKVNTFRKVTQIFFFVLIGLIAVNHGLEELGKSIPWIPSVSLHAICPFGGVETFISFISLGVIVKKIHSSALVLMTIIFILSLAFGAVFCGWVCPLGSIQEWFGKIGKKLFGAKYNRIIPKKLDKILSYIRYINLVLVVYLTTTALKLVFVDVDPYYALFKFWTSEATIGGIIVLVVTLLLSLIVERPWCRYACPYGAILGVFNKFRIFKIRRNKNTCIGCSKCTKVCPMNIDVASKEIVNDTRCISCMQCTSNNACPIEDTVVMSTKKRGENNEG